MSQPKSDPPNNWRLTWSDEFEGDSLDATKWCHDLGNGFFDYASHCWIAGWGNEELQYYTQEPANISVANSVLTIRAVKASLHGCGYTSARIKTRSQDGTALFAQRYGRFEFRAKVPWGKGVWPALWMLPLADHYGRWAASGEIDVMEIHGEQPARTLGSIHYGSAFPERSLTTHTLDLPPGQQVDDWHVYTVEWEPGEIRWLFDNKVWARQDFWWSCSRTKDGKGVQAQKKSDLNAWPAPFDQPFYLLMNVAVGGNFPGHPNAETHFPAELMVDYVRVYERVAGYAETVPRSKARLPYQPEPPPSTAKQ